MSVGSVNIALPSIGRDLGIDNANVTWVVAAYSYIFNYHLALTAELRTDVSS
jgi:hypothetical protein